MFQPTHQLLDHIKALGAACRAAGAEVVLAGDGFQALVRRGHESLVLHPQFLMRAGGGVRRTPMLQAQSEAFLGWTAHRNVVWPIAIDRLEFKRYAAQEGLRVPPLASSTGMPPGPVIVRSVAPTFEPHARGPFRTVEEVSPGLADGECCEAHVEGDALTVWCLDGVAICAEIEEATVVQGDGVQTLGQLLVKNAEHDGLAAAGVIQAELQECEQVVRHRGLALSAVLAAGDQVVVGLGHGSRLRHLRRRRFVDLRGDDQAGWVQALRQAARILGAAIPGEAAPGALFALRATLDRKGSAWLLDMDASPAVHPAVYLPLVQSLLARPAQPAQGMPAAVQ